jgi:hypothetical protein
MNEPDPPPFIQKNDAPDLPHFGKPFILHGPSGVITFRIDTQSYTHDGHVMLTGMGLAGSETYETGFVRECRGELISAFVTESQYMRLTNAPL